MKIQGKRALITGGARRIGAAIARGLAQKGCHLVLHCHRSFSEAKRLAAELRSYGVDVEVLRADLEKSKEVESLVKVIRRRGNIDILINNASVYYPTPFQRLTLKDWEKIMSVNLTAPFLLSTLLGRKMKSGGRIINLADLAGHRPYADYLPYCVSKGALLSLTGALARELAPKVQVNSISPGPIRPPFWQSQKVVEKIEKRTPLKRWGGEEEIMKAVLFLCESDFTTGMNLVIDGGFHLV